jgi:lipopolysaccharide biosynthesis glycosyltransferase
MKEVVIPEYPVVHYWYEETPWKTPSKRHLRLALLALYKNCYWCGIEMKDYNRKTHEPMPDDMATIDHLISLPERGKGAVVPKVLACNKCNTSRSVHQNPNNPKHRKHRSLDKKT